MSSNYPTDYPPWVPFEDPQNSVPEQPASQEDGNAISTSSYVTSGNMPSWYRVDPDTGDQQGPDDNVGPTWPQSDNTVMQWQSGDSTQTPTSSPDQGWGKKFNQQHDPAYSDALSKYLDHGNRRAKLEEDRGKFRSDWIMPALMIAAAARPQAFAGLRQVLGSIQNQKVEDLNRRGRELSDEEHDQAVQQHWQTMENRAAGRAGSSPTATIADASGRFFRKDTGAPFMVQDTDTNYDLGPQKPGQQKQLVVPKEQKAAAAPAVHHGPSPGGEGEMDYTIDPTGKAVRIPGTGIKKPKEKAQKTGDPKADAEWTRVYNYWSSHPGTNVDDSGNPNDEADAVAVQKADAAVEKYQNRGKQGPAGPTTKKNRMVFDPASMKLVPKK